MRIYPEQAMELGECVHKCLLILQVANDFDSSILYTTNIHKHPLKPYVSTILQLQTMHIDASSILQLWYPLVICYIAIEHGPVEIVDLPSDSMVIFHSFL